jgi:Cof subfamily protein (haloacid dehalogenase superfamily)
MNTRITLVISDVDGTFLPKSRTLSAATLEVVQHLHKEGIKLVLASSRPPRGMKHILEAAGILDPLLPLVSLNGALITTIGGDVLVESQMESRILLGIYGALEDLLGYDKLNFMLLDAKNWWVADVKGDGRYDDFVQREAWSLRMKPYVGNGNNGKDNIHQRMLQPAHKITLLGLQEIVTEAKTRIESLYKGEVTTSSPANPKFLDITAHNVHKGTAVQQLARHFCLEQKQICVIGDGENDVAMFHAVGTQGISIAMAHASDAVRSAARFVSSPDNEDSWATAITTYVLQQEHAPTL